MDRGVGIVTRRPKRFGEIASFALVDVVSVARNLRVEDLKRKRKEESQSKRREKR